MEIPGSFRKAIADTFYDKPVTPMTVETITDAEGGVKKEARAAGEPVLGNVQPVSNELREALLGQSIKADVKITTSDALRATTGDLVSINGEIYEITDAKRYDSHQELLASRWVAP